MAFVAQLRKNAAEFDRMANFALQSVVKRYKLFIPFHCCCLGVAMIHHTAAAPAHELGWFALSLAWVYQACQGLVRHHQLHQPEHVGMFAGSLLPVRDWEHD